MLVKDAIATTGGLSCPEKMPGYAWGIPAARCHRGSKLRVKEGTVCSTCYACKGRYRFTGVEAAYERRYQGYKNIRKDVWFEAMATDILSKCRKVPFFRWFDSGDLQDEDMLWNIVDVVSVAPLVNFWMSTREKGIVKRFIDSKVKPIPANLVIRVSADMIDGPPPAGFTHTSTVSSVHSKEDWATLVNHGATSDNHHCPAPLQGNVCGTCRACWDPAVKNVTYRRH